MSSHSLMKRGWILASAAALGSGLAASTAMAQYMINRAPYPSPPSGYSGPEYVYVYPPPRGTRYSYTAIPLLNVAVQRPITYADLDLRTSWGADELVRRAAATARHLCWQLQFRSLTVDDRPLCFGAAMADVMPQINAAIARARGWNTLYAP